MPPHENFLAGQSTLEKKNIGHPFSNRHLGPGGFGDKKESSVTCSESGTVSSPSTSFSSILSPVVTPSSSSVPLTSTLATSVTMLPSASAVPSSASNSSALSQSKVNAGAIAGGVIGGLVFIALVILGVIYVRRRRRLHTAPSAEFMSGRALINPLGSAPGAGRSTSQFSSTSQLSATPRDAFTAAPPAFTPGNYPYPFPEKLSNMIPL
ncbi:hypothetical protein EV368DRAFT_84080 [Lentinula lateritia]|uniref:Uncharacterized protein n=1 Tax=Lentinula aff. lateritia TaxID=2804960 RepID=A0ACC1UG84_9AGAR|nr:hypothetical protein F5876DRAFT_71789 [Lentinula aff. lateritia]KAJ3850904.1 hypothetical protein EV368DRAFT_84080 [Lentinula lateritia]